MVTLFPTTELRLISNFPNKEVTLFVLSIIFPKTSLEFSGELILGLRPLIGS